ncbi:suppressor of deletion of TFIIS [Binucleata daphniae]
MQKPFLIPLKQSSVDIYRGLLTNTDAVLVFDIDNTLYCESSGLCAHIKKQIYNYAATKNIEKEKIKDICDNYTKTYGLAIKGFLADFPDTDPEEFNLSVDGCANLSQYIKKDAKLREMLNDIKLTKYCFTNANYKHAIGVLETLNIYDCFDAIFYCEYTKDGMFVCKPDNESFEIVQNSVGADTEIHFFEDSEINIESAIKFGWKCYYITVENNIMNVLNKFVQENIIKPDIQKQEDIKVKVAEKALKKDVIEKTFDVKDDIVIDNNNKDDN